MASKFQALNRFRMFRGQGMEFWLQNLKPYVVCVAVYGRGVKFCFQNLKPYAVCVVVYGEGIEVSLRNLKPYLVCVVEGLTYHEYRGLRLKIFCSEFFG